ncbi:MAG: hypothetical protein ACTSSP_10440, partial [Candidatus Asgardarchaeia archaeon]
MKKLIILIVIMMSLATSLLMADVSVKGYYRKNGTYVAPHYRSNPDGNPYNNWSTKGNINPYTGKIGTKSVGVGSYNSAIGYIKNYDTRKNCIYQKSPEGYEIWAEYDKNNNKIYQKESDGYKQWEWEYDKSNNPIYYKISDGYEHRKTVDGKFIYVKWADGWQCWYDKNENRVLVVDSNNVGICYEYDKNNNKIYLIWDDGFEAWINNGEIIKSGYSDISKYKQKEGIAKKRIGEIRKMEEENFKKAHKDFSIYTSKLNYIIVGSTENDVRRIIGNPLRISEKILDTERWSITCQYGQAWHEYEYYDIKFR